ncbi:MAG: AI-2E family transporter [Clostridia bacterium]|nr:AI-2E family transporter [Clostridia bacterium]
MKNKKYFTIALWVFLTFVACFLFYTAIENGQTIASGIAFWAGLFSPFATGFVIAYIVNFVLRFVEGKLEKGGRPKKPKTRRTLALVISYVLALAIVVLILLLIIPQLIQSISGLTSKISATQITEAFGRFSDWLHSTLSNNSFILEQTDSIVAALSESLGTLISSIPKLIPDIVNFIAGLTSGLSNFVVGVVVSIYMLYDKERLCARAKKILLAILKKESADKTIGLVRAVNDTVGSFLSGKIIVSFFIGLLAFIGFAASGMEIAVLLAVIIGITNIVPFFGPIIGGIIGGIILVLVNPAKLWIYIIIVIILQQLDGNIIGPKVLGRSTGLDPLWIVVSILLGGGLFGFWGMILGVPVFAVIYALVRRWVDFRLKQKGMESTSTEDFVAYKGEGIVLNDPGEIRDPSPKKTGIASKIKDLLRSKLFSGKNGPSDKKDKKDDQVRADKENKEDKPEKDAANKKEQ